MKTIAAVTILFAAFCLNALADDDNPYASIVVRNVFSLVPIPTNPPADTKPLDPPAKITPNGIMTLFGQLQVLFKVATPPKPGQPPQDQSYVMSEGDRQDGISVTKIDESAGMITFDNHGIVQTLPLNKATDISTPAAPAAPGGRVGLPPGMRRFGLGRNPNGGMPSPAANYGGNNPVQQVNQQSQLSPEAQALLIEKSRIDTQDQVNQGLLPPLPPTAITPSGSPGSTREPSIP